MLKRIVNFLKNRINRIYEYYKFFDASMKELSSLCDLKKRTIWFIGSAHYSNIGDLAISEATVNFLEKYTNNSNIIEIRLCDYYRYLKSMKKMVKKDDIIVLQGGGNMGFAYFDAEYNRRSVIKKFKNNKIIIFPSTIDYGQSPREKIELKKSICIYNNHKNLIICAREEKSYEFMKKIYNNVILVPDIVLSLGFNKITTERNGMIVCLRKDREKTDFSLKLLEYLRDKKNCLFTDNVANINNISIGLRKQIFNEKLNELSKAKVVITDRLHTMIFCTLIEVPCLFIDNTNGKLSGVYDKWIKEKCNYIIKIDSNKEIDKQISYCGNLNINHISDFSMDFQILKQLFE